MFNKEEDAAIPIPDIYIKVILTCEQEEFYKHRKGKTDQERYVELEWKHQLIAFFTTVW